MRIRRTLVLISSLVAVVSTGTGAGLASARPARAPQLSAMAGPVPGTAHSWPAGLVPAVLTHGANPAAPVSLSFLDGVYCTGRRDCWAVGIRLTAAGAAVDQLLHWTGTTWRGVTAPNPGGTKPGNNNVPAAVRCTTAQDCWVVGYYDGGTGSRNEILHWNGRAWSAVRAPQPAGTGKTSHNQLTDITCSSARSCWATGYFGKDNSSTLNEVLHWNGKAWSRLRVPEPAGTTKTSVNQLHGVRCPSASRCLAVGTSWSASQSMSFNQAQTWAGRSWARQPVPSLTGGTSLHIDQLSAIGCGSSTSCFAVGYAEVAGGKLLNQAVHWNGRAWSRSITPQPGGTGSTDQNQLNWVTCTSARDCWAVGYYGHGGLQEVARNQAEHWNGRRWIYVHTPNPATKAHDFDVLMSVRCTEPASCWAVGGQTHGDNVTDEILHWNGTKWQIWR